MAHYARPLVAISFLMTATFSVAAQADDQGKCRKIYQSINGEMIRRNEVNASEDSNITTGIEVVAATGSIYSFAKRQWVTGVLAGGIAAGVAALNYFSNKQADALATSKQKFIIERSGSERDAAFIFEVYTDALGGQTNTEATTAMLSELAIDKQREDKILQHLVDEMENGNLCDGNRPKALGTVFAELKNYDETRLR